MKYIIKKTKDKEKGGGKFPNLTKKSTSSLKKMIMSTVNKINK